MKTDKKNEKKEEDEQFIQDLVELKFGNARISNSKAPRKAQKQKTISR